jgi:hypothetical protein
MKQNPNRVVRRRDLLRVALAGATVASVLRLEPAHAKPVDMNHKRRGRYRATSAEVQSFYRVNSYPTG